MADTAGSATLGVLMLDNSFQRFEGDLGNPSTFDFPVLFERVPGATTEAITTISSDAFLEPFAAAALRLVTRGADGIATSCGFLAIYQKSLAARLPVPIVTSALLQISWVAQMLPKGQRVGVLTFNGDSLGAPHLAGVGAPLDTPIVGLPRDGRFRRALLGDRKVDSYEAREREAIEAARDLVSRHDGIGAIVLECTNLVPHARAIHEAVKLPVYDVWTLVSWFHAGLRPRAWARQ